MDIRYISSFIKYCMPIDYVYKNSLYNIKNIVDAH